MQSPLGGLEAGSRDRAVHAWKRVPGSKEADRKETRREETPHSCYGGLKGVAKAVP